VAKLDVGDLQHKQVDPKKLHPNPWNPNKMDDATLPADRQSIATYGFIDPITVRPLQGKRGHFQIIDGEHRWKIATEDKLPKVPVVVLDLDDVAAKKLTIVLNETRGQADTVLLSALLNELAGELGDDLGDALRWSPKELESILAVGDDDWEQYNPEGLQQVSFNAWDGFSMQVRAPEDFESLWSRAYARVADQTELDEDQRVANGQVVEEAVKALLATKPKGD
jgi:ParB/RepB/Spo0J family partition protein